VGERRYRIEELIGRGGFGAVYRATLLGEGGFVKPVALKVVDSKHHDASDRLIDEARLLGRMQHRAIPSVDGLVTLDDGRKALVLEHVPGADLHRVFRGSGPIPPGALAAIGSEVAAALDAALRAPGPQGAVVLIHRDIKPANVMLTPTGDVRVLDFGIAKGRVERVSRTRTGEAIGTTRYMAPEALAGRPVPASDVYSLAVTLLRVRGADGDDILALRPPSDHASAVADRVAAAGLPRPMQALLLRMLSHAPADRPHAAEVAERLRAIAHASPPPRLEAFAASVFATPLPARADDPLVGQELTEVASEPTPSPTGRGRWLALGGTAAALGTAGIAGMVAVGALALAAAAIAWAMWDRPRAVHAAIDLVPEQITSDRDLEEGLGLSADGRFLVWVERGTAQWIDRPAAPSTAHPIGPSDAYFASISATGDRVWVSAGDHVYELERSTGAQRDRFAGSYAQESADGAWLAWLDPDGAVRLGRRGEPRRTAKIVSTEASHPRWSTRGTILALVGSGGLELLDVADGTRVRRDDAPLDVAFTGDRIWLRYLRGPADDLAWVPLDDPTAEPVRAHATHHRVHEIAASRSGDLAWIEVPVDYAVDLYELTPDGARFAGAIPLTERWYGRGIAVRDGPELVHSAWRQGDGDNDVLQRIRLDGERADLVTLTASVGQATTRDGAVWVWDTSAHEDSFLKGANAHGGMHLLRIADGEVQAITPLDLDEVAAWSVDGLGRRLAVLDHRGRLTVDAPAEARRGALAEHDGIDSLFDLSPDGAALATAREGELVILDLSGDDAVSLGPVPRDAVFVDDQTLLAHRGDQVVRIDRVTGRSVPLLSTPAGPGHRAELAISPDGRWLAVDRTQIQGDIWLSATAARPVSE